MSELDAWGRGDCAGQGRFVAACRRTGASGKARMDRRREDKGELRQDFDSQDKERRRDVEVRPPAFAQFFIGWVVGR